MSLYASSTRNIDTPIADDNVLNDVNLYRTNEEVDLSTLNVHWIQTFYLLYMDINRSLWTSTNIGYRSLGFEKTLSFWLQLGLA